MLFPILQNKFQNKKSMKQKVFSVIAAALMTIFIGAQAQKVHTIGDSTMAPYDPETTVTRGWAMYLQQFFDEITVVNYAKGGRDARGGYNELWQTVKKNMKAGDYVIIQFAHNDEKNGGMDGVELYDYYLSIGDKEKADAVDQRGTNPSTTYKECLRKIIDEVTALGGHPLLVSPICRAQWTDNKIRRSGRHDLGDSFSKLTENGPTTENSVPQDDHSMDYPYQMRLLAEEMNVPFIDLTTATAELYESYGAEKTGSIILDGQGCTHLGTVGAVLVARKCAELMKKQNILADKIILPTDITVSPSDGSFGEAYKGQTMQKEFTLSGFGLSPENGTVNISASRGISLSTDKSNWRSSLSVDYQASTLVQTFYAQLTLTEVGEFTGSITISQGDKTVDIPVTATSILLEGGTEVSAYWRLESDDVCRLEGPATVVPETWKGMYVQRYANPNAATVWPDWTGFDASRKTQRNLIIGDNWPADEIDDNPERYIEFGIQANVGSTLKIDSIGMFICGCGGNSMLCHIYYSTDNFQTRKTIFSPTSLPANNMQAVQARPVITLEEGRRLLVRIYPWSNNSAVSGKTICLSDVFIHGRVYEEGNPDNIELPSDSPLELSKAELHNSAVSTDNVDIPQIDAVADTATATFSLHNTSPGTAYKVSFDAASQEADHSLHFVITDKATDKVELDKIVNIEAGGEFALYDVSSYQLSNGLKTFTVAFSGKSSVRNIVFTPLGEEDLCKLETSVLPAAEAGIVTVDPAYGYFSPGTKVTLTADANKGYKFRAWLDAKGKALSTTPTYTFFIDDNTSITADFEEVELLNNIPTNEQNPFTMENGTLESSKSQASFGSDHHIDYMYNNDYATYKLQNLIDAEYYDISFTAGTKQADVSLNFALSDSLGVEIYNRDIEIENNGDWSADSRSYTLRTGEMPKGKYTLVITFHSVGGNGTTANVNHIKFDGKPKGEISGIDTGDAETSVTLTVTYYTVDGRQLSAPVKGLNILRKLQSDGTVIVEKVIKE